MTDIERLRQLSGVNAVTEDDGSKEKLDKIRRGISAYVQQERDHHWPFGFEKEMAKFVMAELDKEEPKDTIPYWGDRT
jgi:hypothetical protein